MDSRSSRKRIIFLVQLLFGVMLHSGCSTFVAVNEFNQASALFKAGRIEEAHAHALAASEMAPNSATYKGMLAWTYLKKGDIETARQLFSTILEKKKDHIAGIQGLAWVAYTTGNYTEARNGFERQRIWAQDHIGKASWVYYKDSDRRYVQAILSDAYYGLGLNALAQKEYTQAEESLLLALEFPNSFIGSVPILNDLANVYFIQSRFSDAEIHYKKSLVKEYTETAKVNWSWCLLYTARYDEAANSFAEGLRVAEDKRPFIYGLIFTSYRNNDKAGYRNYLQELYDIDYSYVDPQNLLAGLEKAIGKKPPFVKETAKAYLEVGAFINAYSAIGYDAILKKEDCDAQLMAAWCELYLNQLSIAYDSFDLLNDSGYCREQKNEAMLGKGIVSLYQGRLDEAAELFSEVIANDPQLTRARVARGAVAFLRKDYEDAIAIYNSELGNLPAKEHFFSWGSHALNNLGWSYIHTQQFSKAVPIFEKLNQYHYKPIYSEGLVGLGYAYLSLEENEAAKIAFENALQLSPQNPTAEEGLAKISSKFKE